MVWSLQKIKASEHWKKFQKLLGSLDGLKVAVKVKVTSICNTYIVVPWEGRIWGTDSPSPAEAGAN